MCTYPVQLFAHSSCTSLVILIFIKSTVDCIAHFSSLHILLLILFYCFYLLSSFLSYYYLYLNICSCVMYHLLFLFFLHCPLSGPVLTSISLLIIPCMIVYVTNKREPWTFFVSIGPNSERQRENGANQMIRRTWLGISLCFLLKSTLPNPHISTTRSTALQTCVISSEHLILSSVPLHRRPPLL